MSRANEKILCTAYRELANELSMGLESVKRHGFTDNSLAILEALLKEVDELYLIISDICECGAVKETELEPPRKEVV